MLLIVQHSQLRGMRVQPVQAAPYAGTLERRIGGALDAIERTGRQGEATVTAIKVLTDVQVAAVQRDHGQVVVVEQQRRRQRYADTAGLHLRLSGVAGQLARQPALMLTGQRQQRLALRQQLRGAFVEATQVAAGQRLAGLLAGFQLTEEHQGTGAQAEVLLDQQLKTLDLGGHRRRTVQRRPALPEAQPQWRRMGQPGAQPQAQPDHYPPENTRLAWHTHLPVDRQAF